MDGPSIAADAQPSILLGRYQLLERIGEGGMGVVWRCFDLDLEEPVAIKFLREEFSRDEALRASFRREVKLARRVTHPNVTRMYELGRDGEVYFLTMEYVAGESLQARLAREGRLPVELVAALGLGLSRGLAAAHAAGVVHGDIKPGNVLISPGRGAVLTDFGVARVLSEAHLVGAEDWGGTPLYMAPEQFLSSALSMPCDVHAFGVLLFEALTGEAPWPNHDMGALIAAKYSDEPDLGALAHGFHPAWRALIADCLHRDPERRPPDGRALLARLAALRGAASPGPTSPVPTTG